MPSNSRYRNLRYKTKTYNVKKYKKSAMSVARKALRFSKGEQKFIDTQGTAAAMAGTGVFVQLTNIGQGNTDITRQGDQIRLTSLDFNAFVKVGTSGSALGTNYGVYLIEDKQTNGAELITGNLLTDTTIGDNIVTHLNLDNKFRFRILKRWKGYVNLAGKSSAYLKFYHKFPDSYKIRYNGTGTDITALSSKSLILLFMCDEATNVSTITHSTRIRFLDN